jgi:hypothetical protein
MRLRSRRAWPSAHKKLLANLAELTHLVAGCRVWSSVAAGPWDGMELNHSQHKVLLLPFVPKATRKRVGYAVPNRRLGLMPEPVTEEWGVAKGSMHIDYYPTLTVLLWYDFDCCTRLKHPRSCGLYPTPVGGPVVISGDGSSSYAYGPAVLGPFAHTTLSLLHDLFTLCMV